jgi:hypothetical protein
MQHNVGGIDRQIRIVLGAVLVLAGLFAPLDPVWRIVFFVGAAIAFITAITGL